MMKQWIQQGAREAPACVSWVITCAAAKYCKSFLCQKGCISCCWTTKSVFSWDKLTGEACRKMEILKEDLFICYCKYSVNKEPLKDFAFWKMYKTWFFLGQIHTVYISIVVSSLQVSISLYKQSVSFFKGTVLSISFNCFLKVNTITDLYSDFEWAVFLTVLLYNN